MVFHHVETILDIFEKLLFIYLGTCFSRSI